MKLFIVLLLFVLILPASVQARSPEPISWSCAGANYHPALAMACFIAFMLDNWNPLDWGDDVRGDADDVGGVTF